MNLHRKDLGHFQNLVQFIKTHDKEQFFKYTRMTDVQFDSLLALIEPRLKRAYKGALHPAERLCITLHYLSGGCSMQQLAWDYYIGKSTGHYIIKETCEVLWECLMPIYLKPPTREDFVEIADGFYKRWNIPNCIGAVDGKHVSIQAPKLSGSDFFNYKKHFSLVLMASCDSYYRFTMVDIGAAGSNHDSYVFKESGFGSAAMNGSMGLPPESSLPDSNIVLPHFLVGDEAFPLHENIMRPYPGRYLGERKNIFNYRLSRARRTIENTFGILVQRWRILRKPIVAQIENCEAIVKATVILHNFLQKEESDIPVAERRYCQTGFNDYIDDDGNLHYGTWKNRKQPLHGIRRLGSNNSSRTAQTARDQLTDWFQADGLSFKCKK